MFTAPHMYVTVHGDCYAGAEYWQFGLRLSDGGASSVATALALAPVIEAWWRGTGYALTDKFTPIASHRLTELKVARIGVDGKYEPNEIGYSHFYLPAIAGTAGVPSGTVAQNTICATLLTAVPRGLASHGRIFLPPSGSLIPQADGRFEVVATQGMARCVRQLITSINAEALVGNVQVMSRGKGVRIDNPAKHRWDYTYPNPGRSENVTTVGVGRVMDTQRRRRRQLVEDRQGVAL